MLWLVASLTTLVYNVGLDYRRATFSDLNVDRPRVFRAFCDELEGVKEVMLLATCNRVELYASSDQPIDLCPLFCSILGIRPDLVVTRSGRAAREHILSVVSGLDSLVVGETQVVHQVRTAMKNSYWSREGRGAHELSRLVSDSIALSRRLDRESNSYNKWVRQRVDELTTGGGEVHIVGAGQMGRSVLGALSANHSVYITTRNSSALSDIAGATVVQWDKRFDAIVAAETVVLCAPDEELVDFLLGCVFMSIPLPNIVDMTIPSLTLELADASLESFFDDLRRNLSKGVSQAMNN